MSTDPPLTPAQSKLLSLLREIGGIEEEELYREFEEPWRVALIMVGDNATRVRVLIGPYGDVEWEVLG